MKLPHLLQKCSFFLIKLAAFQASGGACMKLRQNGTVFRLLNWPLWQLAGTANRRMSNIEFRRMETLR
jgi:hypothetical protein